MAFKAVNLIPGVGDIEYLVKSSQQFTNGSLLVRDLSNGYVTVATAATGTDTRTIEAISVTATGTSVAGTAYLRAIPLSAITYVIADCTNNTADNQLNKSHILTDAATVANTSTNIATTAAVFTALKKIGADSDKKLFGYLIKTSIAA